MRGYIYKNAYQRYHYQKFNKGKNIRNERLLNRWQKLKEFSHLFYLISKSIRMLSLRYHELTGKIEELEGKKYLIVGDYMLNKALDDNIQEITGIEKFDNTMIFIDTEW